MCRQPCWEAVWHLCLHSYPGRRPGKTNFMIAFLKISSERVTFAFDYTAHVSLPLLELISSRLSDLAGGHSADCSVKLRPPRDGVHSPSK